MALVMNDGEHDTDNDENANDRVHTKTSVRIHLFTSPLYVWNHTVSLTLAGSPNFSRISTSAGLAA